MASDQAYDNAMSGWPKHMYVNEDEKGAIRCLASGCTHTFTTNESMESRVMHYTEREASPFLSDLCRNEHGLLKQMHSMKKCICGSPQPDSRDLFKHIIVKHPEEKDISTVPGFLVYVRRFAHLFPADKADKKQHRNETFKLSFEHLVLGVKKPTYWEKTMVLVSNFSYGTIPSDDKLRKYFTKAEEDNEYLPYYPPEFLNFDLQHYYSGPADRIGVFRTLIQTLQRHYREGWM